MRNKLQMSQITL